MKIIHRLKTIAAYDLKVGSYTELNDLMKLHEYGVTCPGVLKKLIFDIVPCIAT